MAQVDRRRFLAGAAALAVAPVARPQRKDLSRVGYLFSFVPSEGEHLWAACRQGLAELGYVEGRNIALEPRWANGRHERLPELVAELVRANVDVVVSAATPASLAAKRGAGRTPIVFVAVADPVRAKLVETLARPGGTATGLTLLTPELSPKRLELLLEIAGPIARCAVLINPANSAHEIFTEETEQAARARKVAVQRLHARTPEEIERAVAEAHESGAQGLIVFDDPVTWSHRKLVVAQAAKARLPVMYGYSEFVDEGGLVSYGPQRPDLYRRTAGYVDKILRGASPATLAVERPSRFELFLNRACARALGLKIPASMAMLADRVIE
ncbi:MAG TPA: ABC transporter substrate-binding protein [Burkholderiales bacterium]|nr:ABC transporter substrate-binding protein [Burkholderiales bacterium]